jgi:hypothetical protein
MYRPAVATMMGTVKGKRDFFISFNQADRAWATWIAWVLEEAGYTVFFQYWDFTGNFVLEMDRAHTQSRRTVAILSPDYLTSRFTKPEWAARFARDATSEHDLLIPVRVRPCDLEGLFAQIVDVDLVGCDEAAARDKLVKRVEGIRLKPNEPPLFPGDTGHKAVPEQPAFPAAARTAKHEATKERLALAGGWRAPLLSLLTGAIFLAALVVVVTVWFSKEPQRKIAERFADEPLAITIGYYSEGRKRKSFDCVPQPNPPSGFMIFGLEYGPEIDINTRGCVEVNFCDSAGEFCRRKPRSRGCYVNRDWYDWYKSKATELKFPVTYDAVCGE